MTRTKQCEVVLKIRTDTLQGTRGKKDILNRKKMQQHTTYCIMGNRVAMSEAYSIVFKFKRKSRLS